METSVADYTLVVQKKNSSEKKYETDYIAAKKAALTIKALNHNIRKHIIHLLIENKRMQVNDIHKKLAIQQAVVSQHLAILRKANFVTVNYTKDDCRVIYYSLNHDRIAEIAAFLNNLATTVFH